MIKIVGKNGGVIDQYLDRIVPSKEELIFYFTDGSSYRVEDPPESLINYMRNSNQSNLRLKNSEVYIATGKVNLINQDQKKSNKKSLTELQNLTNKMSELKKVSGEVEEAVNRAVKGQILYDPKSKPKKVEGTETVKPVKTKAKS